MPYHNNKRIQKSKRIYSRNYNVFLEVSMSPTSYLVYPPPLGFKQISSKKMFVEADLLSKWFYVWAQKRHLLDGAFRHSPHQKLQVCNILIDTLQLDATFEKKKKTHMFDSHMVSEAALKSQHQCEDDENKKTAVPNFDSFSCPLLLSEITAGILKCDSPFRSNKTLQKNILRSK